MESIFLAAVQYGSTDQIVAIVNLILTAIILAIVLFGAYRRMP